MSDHGWVKNPPQSVSATDTGGVISLPSFPDKSLDAQFVVKNTGSSTVYLVPSAPFVAGEKDPSDWLDSVAAGAQQSFGPYALNVHRSWCLAVAEGSSASSCKVVVQTRSR